MAHSRQGLWPPALAVVSKVMNIRIGAYIGAPIKQVNVQE